MPTITSADGTKLYYEEAGIGTPVVFVHEFAGDYRTWEPQMRAFSRSHRCVTFSARGYPPSEVPSDPARYGQDIARADVVAIMDALGIAKAHVVGHSMGAYTALHIGIRHAERCISVTAAGCGWGSVADPAMREAMRKVAAENAKLFTDNDIKTAAAIYADQPLPVIVVSAFFDPELIARAEKNHVLAYLVKPIKRHDLEPAIAIAMSRFEEFMAVRSETTELLQALEDRKVIEHAKTILMKRTRLDEPAAFRRLQMIARSKNRKLVEIARGIVTVEEAYDGG